MSMIESFKRSLARFRSWRRYRWLVRRVSAKVPVGDFLGANLAFATGRDAEAQALLERVSASGDPFERTVAREMLRILTSKDHASAANGSEAEADTKSAVNDLMLRAGTMILAKRENEAEIPLRQVFDRVVPARTVVEREFLSFAVSELEGILRRQNRAREYAQLLATIADRDPATAQWLAETLGAGSGAV